MSVTSVDVFAVLRLDLLVHSSLAYL